MTKRNKMRPRLPVGILHADGKFVIVVEPPRLAFRLHTRKASGMPTLGLARRFEAHFEGVFFAKSKFAQVSDFDRACKSTEKSLAICIAEREAKPTQGKRARNSGKWPKNAQTIDFK